MSKFQSPLLGYNNNVRHKGRVFHIQTEDSGVKHPHVITHLFADGGRILKTAKTPYGEQIHLANIEEIIRGIMKEQHKAMFIALRDGAFDHLLDGPGELEARAARAKGPVSKPAESPAAPEVAASPSGPRTAVTQPLPAQAAPAEPRSVVVSPPSGAGGLPKDGPEAAAFARSPTAPPVAPSARPEAAAPAKPTGPARLATPPAPYPLHPTEPQRRRPSGLPPPVPPPNARRSAPPAPVSVSPSTSPTPRQGLPMPAAPLPNVDLSAIERAAEAFARPAFAEVHNLPPPPAAVLKRRGTPGRSLTPSGTPALGNVVHSAGRYAVSRPSTIFSTTRPQEGMSIFGEDLISEKTLDEVILSYLADDLDPGEEGGSR